MQKTFEKVRIEEKEYVVREEESESKTIIKKVRVPIWKVFVRIFTSKSVVTPGTLPLCVTLNQTWKRNYRTHWQRIYLICTCRMNKVVSEKSNLWKLHGITTTFCFLFNFPIPSLLHFLTWRLSALFYTDRSSFIRIPAATSICFNLNYFLATSELA